MPYRRLPNTDKARLRALARAHKKFESEGASNLPFSESTLLTLRTIFPKFKNVLINLEAARKNQATKNKDYIEIYRKARMYVSHYIQVMNFAISRSEIKPVIREFYGTQDFDNNLPPLSTENDLLDWGKRIIEGDQKRVMNGGNPFYNPSIALVKVNYEKFTDAYRFQKTLQTSSDRFSAQVADVRPEVDSLILQLWNEIEETFANLNDVQKRKKSEDYGVVYVLRKSEKERMKAMEKQSSLNF